MLFLWLILAFLTFVAAQSDLISRDQPVIDKQLSQWATARWQLLLILRPF